MKILIVNRLIRSSTCWLLAIGIACLSSISVLAQETSPETLTKRIEAVSRKAKKVETATGYSEIIKECNAILAEQPENQSHRKYLAKLLGWALDKRGLTRVGLAEQFAKAQSADQAELVRKQALDDFNRSIELDPRRWQTAMHRGAMFAEQQKIAEAIADYSTVIRLNSKHSNAWFNRAEMRFQLGEYESSADDYSHVLEMDPNDLQAVSGRAHCRFALQQNSDALADYDTVVAKLPNDGWALANRADAHLAMENWQRAQKDLEQALAKQTNGEFCRRLAWLLATCPDESICDGQKALNLAQRAIEISGETIPNLDTLAAAYAASGEFEKARDVYARVIAMTDDDDTTSAVKQAAYENNERYQEKFDR